MLVGQDGHALADENVTWRRGGDGAARRRYPRRVIRSAFAALAAGAIALAACGGGPVVGSTRVVTPLSEIVRAHKALLVTSAPTRDAFRADGRAIATRVAQRLEKLGYFSVVVDEAAAAHTEVDLELTIEITELVRVTAREREGRGSDAGEVKAIATVRLVDRANHAELGRAVVRAAGYEGPRGGVTEDADDAIADQIFALVEGRGPGG
ncbi:MAG TPA: hypothetical protein VGM56_09630 [Byssovorax sp.]